MLSGVGSYQSANISYSTNSAKDGQGNGAQVPGLLSVGKALDAHTSGAASAFGAAASQISEAFLELIEHAKNDEDGNGKLDSEDIEKFVTSMSYSSSLNAEVQMSNDAGGSVTLNLAAASGLMFELEKTDGVMTGFKLDFAMSTEMSFQSTNSEGGYTSAQFSNLQSFSMSYTIGEDDDGNKTQSLTFNRTEYTQMSMLSAGPSGEVGSMPSLAQMFDITGSNNGTSGIGSSGVEKPALPEPEPNFNSKAALQSLIALTNFMAEQRKEIEAAWQEKQAGAALQTKPSDDDISIKRQPIEVIEPLDASDEKAFGLNVQFVQVSQFSASYYSDDT